MSIVLMYHAIYRDNEDLERIDSEDRPYAVTLADFTAQMEQVARLGHGVLETPPGSARKESLPQVIVTFDDGHISNVELALPVLRRLNIRAYFFVTSGFIDRREHFCGWEDLQQLLAGGMIVGSHGITHRFFDDMSKEQRQQELAESKREIERQLGIAVNSLSFPGGRYNCATLACARDAGYSQIFGSDFGRLRAPGELMGSRAIKRIPVRQTTTLMQFSKIVHGDSRFFFVQGVKNRLKQGIKLTVGNRIYHGLYTAFAKKR